MLIGALLLGTAVGSVMLVTTVALGGTLMQSVAIYVIGGAVATLASATLFSLIAPTEDNADTLPPRRSVAEAV